MTVDVHGCPVAITATVVGNAVATTYQVVEVYIGLSALWKDNQPYGR